MAGLKQQVEKEQKADYYPKSLTSKQLNTTKHGKSTSGK